MVAERIKADCPGVVWKESFAALGRFDVVDVVESADAREVEKAAIVIRVCGHSTTETLLDPLERIPGDALMLLPLRAAHR